MSRNLTAGMQLGVDAAALRPVVFVESEFASGTLRLWTGYGQIEWNGQTWTGGGNLLGISEIAETADVRAVGITVSLSGMPAPVLSAVLGQARQGKPVKVWLGFFEPEYVEFDFTLATLTAKVGAGVAAITFTRAGATATRVNAAGLIETVAANTPRFDHDPATLAIKGLLIEEARTNLCLRSEQIDFWAANQISVNVDSDVAPTGAATADSIQENTANAAHYADQPITFAPSTAYSATAYVKQRAGSRNAVLLFYTDAGGDQATIIVNPSTGAIVQAAAAQGGMTAVSGAVEQGPQGFWKIKLSGTTDASAGVGAVRVQLASGTTLSYTGDGTSKVLFWGVDVQAGAFPTSYIPTTSAAVTRNADLAVVSSIGGFFNAIEGTVVAEASFPSNGADDHRTVASFDDGTADAEVVWVFSQSLSLIHI